MQRSCLHFTYESYEKEMALCYAGMQKILKKDTDISSSQSSSVSKHVLKFERELPSLEES